MSYQPNSMRARDAAYQVHPATDMIAHEEEGSLIMSRGKGIYLYDDSGKEYLEAMAGMWSASLGFSESRLAEAAYAQLKLLPYSQTFTHRSNEPSIELAENLIRIAPVPMSKVIFQGSGSDAADAAVKLAWYYHNAIGKPQKRKVISRQRAYHGSSISSGSLTGLEAFHASFNLPIEGVVRVSCPHYYSGAAAGETEEEFSTRLAAELEETILREGPDTIAAFIAEPIMGVAGVIIPPIGYFEKVETVLKEHEILFIADEVICGFGRTGKMWGTQSLDLHPDMITTAKALSASYLPISAVMFTDRIYQAIRIESHRLGGFGHGYTYSGHPVCAAVANEAIKIYEERDIVSHVARVGDYLQRRLGNLKSHPLIGEVRGIGLAAGLELVRDKATRTGFRSEEKVPQLVSAKARDLGLIVRAAASSVLMAPPLIITEGEVDVLVERLEHALDDAWAEISKQ